MFNAFSPQGFLDPFPLYARLRAERPVWYQPQMGTWLVSRYADTEALLNDYARFSSVRNPQLTQTQPNILNLDPPRHRQLRQLVTQAFTPRAVAQLTERITSLVTQMLDQVASQGTMDVVADLAYPLPVIVIADMLGIPTEDRALFKEWSDALVGTQEDERSDSRAEMAEYFLDIIAARRVAPQADLVSALLAAQVEGEHLTQAEVLSFCVLLLVAGNETTTNLLGNALLCLTDFPDAMHAVRTEPDLIPSAVEEVLRYHSPVQFTGRVATTDVVLDDQTIRAGDRVRLVIGSANRDEAQFPNAETFDVRRTPNRHLAFGHGIHFCLGAPLARLETALALRLLLGRFSDIRRVPDVALERVSSPLMYGVKRLPLTFHQR